MRSAQPAQSFLASASESVSGERKYFTGGAKRSPPGSTATASSTPAAARSSAVTSSGFGTAARAVPAMATRRPAVHRLVFTLWRMSLQYTLDEKVTAMPLRSLSPLAKTFKTFFGRDDAILREALKAIRPEELAIIVNNLSEGEQLQVLTLLDDAKLGRVIWEVSPHARHKLLGKLSRDRFMSLIGGLESDEAVDLVQLLDR